MTKHFIQKFSIFLPSTGPNNANKISTLYYCYKFKIVFFLLTIASLLYSPEDVGETAVKRTNKILFQQK